MENLKNILPYFLNKVNFKWMNTTAARISSSIIICCSGIIFFSCSTSSSKQFEKIRSEHSGIHFNNNIEYTDSLNAILEPNIYNGGGVGIGDFNNDGLQDIYFTGNFVDNKLYLNKGDFVFEDISEEAGVTSSNRFCRGVTVLDINSDGWMDIYVSATILRNSALRKNLLYINKGLNENDIPVFQEQAVDYGLDDEAHTTMAYFFDYDRDGDLDVYLVNNEIVPGEQPGTYRKSITQKEHPNTDKLLENNWDEESGHPVFTDVSQKSGITFSGFGHSASIADINHDGWDDIYVSNDFAPDNTLYINQQNGTFQNETKTYFKHTAENAMGNDIIDINNDGLDDIVELDMMPEDNYRRKAMQVNKTYDTYQLALKFDYQVQYPHNAFQLNMGNIPSINRPVFSEIGYLSGIAETDWSWSPIIADFDHDGYRDLYITNGYPKDITDGDFVSFRINADKILGDKEILEHAPIVKTSNYMYQNQRGYTFKETTKDWGLDIPSFSNGGAYVDLDNDGDLDLVVNNINMEAFIFKNNNEKTQGSNNYLQIQLKGKSPNIAALGANVSIYYGDKFQTYRSYPFRGYCSTVDSRIHFGLPKLERIDSVVVNWNPNLTSVVYDVPPNQMLAIDVETGKSTSLEPGKVMVGPLFTDVTKDIGFDYKPQNYVFSDFNVQNLLPHKMSELGPMLASGDINRDGREDFVVGGQMSMNGYVFFQQENGKFTQVMLPKSEELPHIIHSDLVLKDLDNDGDLDIYTASGGNYHPDQSKIYQDIVYVNDGAGNFTVNYQIAPKNLVSKSCVKTIDFNKDGKLDIVVGGQVRAWLYPLPVSSFLYENSSEEDSLILKDVTQKQAPGFKDLGLVTDILPIDFDNDGWEDLIFVGEWMPVTFFKNQNGKFVNVTDQTNLAETSGWWRTVSTGDFNQDGLPDLVLGNFGLNTFYNADPTLPISIYVNDFDKNKSIDPIITRYVLNQRNEKKSEYLEFPVHNKGSIMKRLPYLKKQLLYYKDYARATIQDIFPEKQLKQSFKMKANYLASAVAINLGDNQFKLVELPMEAQMSTVNKIRVEDFDQDGNQDILCLTNDFGIEVNVGQLDALNGLLLKGDGKGDFTTVKIENSGFYVPGASNSMIKLKSVTGEDLFIVSQFDNELKAFKIE